MSIRKQSMKIMNCKNRNRAKKSSDKTITSVLLGSYIRTMLISLLFGIFFFLAVTGKEMVYRQNLNSSRILNSFSYFINMQLEDMRRFSYKLMIEEELQSLLDGSKEGGNNQISAFLMGKMAERNEIQSIHVIYADEVVSEYKQPFYGQDTSGIVRQLRLEPIQQDKNRFYWEIGKDSLDDAGKNTFYLAGSIRSKTNLEHLGYLVIFMDINALQKSVNSYLKDMDYEVLIKNDFGDEIVFPDGSDIEQFSPKLVYRMEEDDSWWQVFNMNQYSSQKISGIRGEVYGMMKLCVFRPNVEFALVFMLIVTIEFIIIASVIVKKHVTSPLEEIARRAREIGVQGNLNIPFPNEKYYSEADDISRALNEMMGQIQTLVLEVEQREKLQKRLELSVINHQIKPHFLYNTLNAASILISVEEKNSADQLIKSLAKYYRACLNQGRDIISLDNELEIAQEYIKISLIRNPDILRVYYDIDREIHELQIPKMTIQTLVENCIKYGIKQMGEPIHITISAKCREGYAELGVEDNGSGMKQDMVDKIMKGEPLEAKSGFGLRSVVMRISLLYNIKNIPDIICIDSEEGEYTRVKLRIPYRKPERE